MALLDQLIKILDLLIWPVTLIIILGWFKNELKGFFKNLKKIEAGADGVVFESFEAQMAKTRDLFPASVTQKSSGSIDAKASKFTRNTTLSPKAQLTTWHDRLSREILERSKTASSDAQIVLQEMKSNGLIRFDEYERKSNLLKLTGMESNSITEAAVREIQDYLNEVT